MGGESWVYDLWGNAVAGVSSSGGSEVDEIYAGSRHLATYANGTTYFPLSDWLGTTRQINDVSGNAVLATTNLPFGDGRSSYGSVSDPIQFTGLFNDGETASTTPCSGSTRASKATGSRPIQQDSQPLTLEVHSLGIDMRMSQICRRYGLIP